MYSKYIQWHLSQQPSKLRTQMLGKTSMIKTKILVPTSVTNTFLASEREPSIAMYFAAEWLK